MAAHVNYLKAELALVTDKRSCGAVHALRPSPDDHSGALSLEWRDIAAAGMDHLILVVSNCGLRAGHDDKLGYQLKIETL